MPCSGLNSSICSAIAASGGLPNFIRIPNPARRVLAIAGGLNSNHRTALALVESAIIAVVAYGLGFSFGWLALAVVMRATMGVAVGVAVGVRYRSITHFLLPAIFVSLSFDLPNIWYLNLSASPLFYLWPSMPPLLLAKAAFMPVDPLQLVYAFSYGALAVGGALFWASRSIDRFVVRGELAS